MATERNSGDAGRSVVVGYDGSPSAERAVAWAVQRAGEAGRLYVVHCFGPPQDVIGRSGYQRLLGDHRERGRAILDELALEGRDGLLDVDYELELVGGDPAEAIVDAAKVHDADEIVVGSRGLGPFRAALGSVSHDILHQADRPVVVVPAGD